jgi:hypothetical protein
VPISRFRRLEKKFSPASDALERVHFGAQFRDEAGYNVVICQLDSSEFCL